MWSFSVLPEGFTLAHYATVFAQSTRHDRQHARSTAALAALIDVVLGTAIAYIILRTRLPGRQLLDWRASAALAIPGVVLAIGYLRAFRGLELPFMQTRVHRERGSSW